MSEIARIKGMRDVLPDERRYWNYVIETASELARLYGFEQIDTPIMEKHELFERGIGTSADFFVQKEMYTITEEDGEQITLRPEFTAGVVRAYIQNGLSSWTQPSKLFLVGPIFRRENPQAGRFRQHSQFNCEILGEKDPSADVEVMLLAMTLYRRLGYRGLAFQLNSTGCQQCRPAYIETLRTHLLQHTDKLAPVDLERLQKNPLRVLDSKEAGMESLLANAPHLADHLCDDCRNHFAQVRAQLERLGQAYTINFRLVRGMDYYEKTVFEVWAQGIGAQAAVCGGGRYNLAPEIGGPDLPSVGFGSGIERIIMGMKEGGMELPPAPPLPVMVAHFGGETRLQATEIAFALREAGIGTWLAFGWPSRSFKSQMREADKRGVRFVLIVGEDEMKEGKVTVRPMRGEGSQTSVAVTELVAWLQTNA